MVLIACGKSKTAAPVISPPEKATLLFPVQNSACTIVTVISDTESRVQFSWGRAANTDSYELIIKNLITQASISNTSVLTEQQVNLPRNTPFSWQIISKSDKTATTVASDTWKFYNPGPGALAYAPYPSEIISPTAGQQLNAINGKITLRWSGADADNDLTGYDIYFGTSNNPPLFQSNTTSTSITDVAVNTGTYYWKVIAKDAQGNTSDSGIYQFTVN